MGTRKSGQEEIRNITQNSTGTYQISIPKHLVAELRWTEGQKVTVRKADSSLVVEDWEE